MFFLDARVRLVNFSSWLLKINLLNKIYLDIAIIAQRVDRGIEQLREMGILAMTTEERARRILQEFGGNLDAAVNAILENSTEFD